MEVWKTTAVRLAIAAVIVSLLVGLVYFGLSGRLPWLARLAPGQGNSTAHSHAGHGHTGNGHEHGQGEHKMAATVWSQDAEVFIDHPYPLAGVPVELAIHVTDTRSGQPIHEGTLTFIAQGPDGSPLRLRDRTLVVPGIFAPTLKFPLAGTYQARCQVESEELAGGSVVAELPPITVFATEAAAEEAAHAAEAAEADITFLKDQQWRIGLRSNAVQPRQMAHWLVVPGRVVAPHPAEAMVPPPIPGTVMPPTGGDFPHVGDKVQKGDLLAIIEPSVVGLQAVEMLVNQAQLESLDAELAVKQLDIEARVSETRLDLELAGKTYQRLRDLAQRGVTAGKEFQAAQNQLDQLETRLAGLQKMVDVYEQARKRLSRFVDDESSTAAKDPLERLRVPLRSPINGTIVKADATRGEFVSHDHPLFRIINLQRLLIDADVSQYDLAKVKNAPGASYRPGDQPDRIEPIFPDGGGRMVYVGAVVDPETRTVPVRFEVPNPDEQLRVGMYVDVLIETDRRQQALAVPREAIIDDSGEMLVYVQTGGESFERRPVTVGIQDGKLVEIVSGLQPGERPVVQGAYTVHLSTLSGAVPTHAH